MKNIKSILLIQLFTLLVPVCLLHAQEIKAELKPFNKIVASPRVNLILKQGIKEEITLVYNEVTPDKINIVVKGNTLRIYLDEAKINEKMERVNEHEKRSMYANVSLTAYVTYKDLKHLEIRGNQELTCKDPLTAEKFILKAYGENEINLASIRTDYLKTSLYGENRLKIKGGKADYQKYKLFGENRIDTHDLKSYAATTNIYGESKVRLSTQDELKINAFGESEISFNGDAHVNKGLIFGRALITKLDQQ